MARKRGNIAPSEMLFAGDQQHLFEKSYEETVREGKNKPVECLGTAFPNDEERRKYFLEKLREKLKDPEFRKIEGFPIGSDENILALSDPPYYTACPNPFIDDFIRQYGRPYDPATDKYRREPFASDVSEGKNDPIYNAHSYHTKVPHKAIMRYILHYTEPGDVVFDGFCGTGMTGVAAQLCGNGQAIQALDYRIITDGVVVDPDGNKISKLGERLTILSDLSPLATFVSSNYTHLSPLAKFSLEALKIIDEVEHALSWLYESSRGVKVLRAIWSDVFLCPNCSREFVFWDATLRNGKMQKTFPCPRCGSIVGKSASTITGAVKLDRPFDTTYDPVLKKVVRIPKFVLVEETIRQGSRRKTRKVTETERKNFVAKFEGRAWPAIPIDEFFPGRQTNKLINGTGISHICHMYTPRALFAFGQLWQQKLSSERHTFLLKFCLSAINNYISRKQGYFGGGGGVSGTLFTPSLHLERNVFDVLRRKIQKLRTLAIQHPRIAFTSAQSIVDLRNIPDESVDYVFTDPPFGESLQYAELNMFVEAWLGVKTAAEDDCVLNYVHKKDLPFYSNMMIGAFKEYARVLKPNRWITIEFHNSQNAIWSAIQQAIESSGLVVADVRILDKQQRSFNAVNRAGAVDQDLVISAYKPNGGLEERFKLSSGTEEGVWDFVRMHLKQLPVFVSKSGQAETIAERQNYLLFDRMVAFHVQRGVTVPFSAAEFYQGLAQRFPERDGMYFLTEQVAEYDKKRMTVKDVETPEFAPVDEFSAIRWLLRLLKVKPQTFQEIHPQFIRDIAGWQKHEKPLELSELLEENFLRFDGKSEVPSQIHSYLSTNFKELRNLPKDAPVLCAKAKDRWYVPDPNKAGDLEKLRERALLREFEEYKTVGASGCSPKRLKVFRLEAVRAGFKKAWQERDYTTIIAVAGKIPENVLQEDPKLLMWYDQATTRIGG
jgi:DNA modification methylase/predicted RNA-binding Zn-ribbon protein involved in translation (DUF1610 family)